MRCVRNKSSLFIEHRSDTFEKTIDRCDERNKLGWNTRDRQRLQVIGLLGVKMFGKT